MLPRQLREQLTVPERIRGCIIDSGAKLPVIVEQRLRFVPMKHRLILAQRLFWRVETMMNFL
jgi:hypothetical protein